MILPLLPKMLDFQVSGLIGQGIGRYGSAQIADATFSPTGKIEPLSEYSIMGGFVGHPVPAVDVYAYGGAEGANRNRFQVHRATAIPPRICPAVSGSLAPAAPSPPTSLKGRWARGGGSLSPLRHHAGRRTV